MCGPVFKDNGYFPPLSLQPHFLSQHTNNTFGHWGRGVRGGLVPGSGALWLWTCPGTSAASSPLSKVWSATRTQTGRPPAPQRTELLPPTESSKKEVALNQIWRRLYRFYVLLMKTHTYVFSLKLLGGKKNTITKKNQPKIFLGDGFKRKQVCKAEWKEGKHLCPQLWCDYEEQERRDGMRRDIRRWPEEEEPQFQPDEKSRAE